MAGIRVSDFNFNSGWLAQQVRFRNPVGHVVA